MSTTTHQGAVGAETMTAGPKMVLLPLDDPRRPLNDSGLPLVMILAGGEAYDAFSTDQALDLDSCSFAVGIYRAMTEAHVKEIATLSPAPRTDGGMTAGEVEALARKLHEANPGAPLLAWDGLWEPMRENYRAMARAVAPTPAQPAGAVPDGLRALSEAFAAAACCASCTTPMDCYQGKPCRLEPAGSRSGVVDHEFKSHPDVFWPAARGEKTFEYRRDDRGGYEVGQTVRLRCYDPAIGYEDVEPLDRRITNILRGGEFELPMGYCILSLAPLATHPAGQSAGSGAALDMPLAEDVQFPGIKFGKGVTLRTVIEAARRWKSEADAAVLAKLPASASDSLRPDWHRAMFPDEPAPDSTRTGDVEPCLRAVVEVHSGRTDTRLTFGRGMKHEGGCKAVEQAIIALRAELDQRNACPAAGGPSAGYSETGAKALNAAILAQCASPRICSGNGRVAEGIRCGPCERKALEAALAARPAAPEVAAIGNLAVLQRAAEAGRLRIECRERLDGANPDAGMVWPIEVELPCINGLSAWFTLGNIYSPDRAAQSYTDGALSDDLARALAAHIIRSLTCPAAPEAQGARSQAADDVLAERRRQVEAEGWTPEHDDRHRLGEMCDAAAAYASHAGRQFRPQEAPPASWPWQSWWWKPTTPRHDLVKAGALILAEIERLDRLPAPPASSGQEGR